MSKIHRILFEKKLLTEAQFQLLDAIDSDRIISLYSELRLLLYLGIILFTGGVGYFVYENLGNIGHYLIMGVMVIATYMCFSFIVKLAKPYMHDKVEVENIYFDYVLLLGSLLVAGLLTYLQVYFNLVEYLLNYSSFITAILFLTIAYRYDNKGVLAMGITVLAAAVGLSISPVDWAKGDLVAIDRLYVVSIILGALLAGAGHFSEQLMIKKHFSFTYWNFGLLLYYLGCLTGIFNSDYQVAYAILTLVTAASLTRAMWQQKEFLLFIYSSLASYISISYIIFNIMESIDGFILLIYYIPFSLIAYIVLLIKKKSHFSNDE